MALSFVSQAAANANTVVLPTHAAGDLLVLDAFRDGSNSLPGTPTGWTTWVSGAGDSRSAAVFYLIATSATETDPVSASATNLCVHVYRPGAGNTIAVGASLGATGSGTVVTYPALVLEDTSGSSWVAGFGNHREGNTSLETPPTGMTNRSNAAAAGNEAAGHDTNAGVASWSEQTVDIGGSSNGWRCFSVEIKEVVVAGDATVTPGRGNLVLSGAAPTASRTDHHVVAGAAGNLTLDGKAPVASASAHHVAVPGQGNLTLDGKAPSLAVTAYHAVVPAQGDLVLSGAAPTLVETAYHAVAPAAGDLALSAVAPAVSRTEHHVIAPTAGDLALSGSAPTVARTGHHVIVLAQGDLALSGAAPTVTAPDHRTIAPGAGNLTLEGFAPAAVLGDNVTIQMVAGNLTLSGFAPVLSEEIGEAANENYTGMVLNVGRLLKR